MNIELTSYMLQRFLEQAAELGAIKALIRTGQLKPYLKKSEAFRLYKRVNVERWIDERLITPRKDGDDSAAWRIDRLELEVIVKSKILLHYF